MKILVKFWTNLTRWSVNLIGLRGCNLITVWRLDVYNKYWCQNMIPLSTCHFFFVPPLYVTRLNRTKTSRFIYRGLLVIVFKIFNKPTARGCNFFYGRKIQVASLRKQGRLAITIFIISRRGLILYFHTSCHTTRPFPIRDVPLVFIS